jgi:hypothetical protein
MSLYRCKLADKNFDEYLCWTDLVPAGPTITVPKLIVLFDVSASMGRYVGVIHQALKNLIKEFKLEQVVIITFGAGATRYCMSWKTVDSWRLPPQEDSTRMLDAARLALQEVSGGLTQFMVISDGQVHDLKEYSNWGNVLRNQEWLLRFIQNQSSLSGTIQAAGMRISQDGDTQAVSCFFKFHNHSTCAPMLLDSAYSESDIQVGLLQMFENFKQGCRISQIVVTGLVALDCVIPMQGTISVGPNQIFIARGDVLVNGLSLKLVDKSALPADQVEQYLEQLEHRIRTLKVLGTNLDIKRINTFVNNVGSIVLQPLDETKDFRGQVRAVMRASQSRYKTIIVGIQQLLNLNNVDRFNAQQQADFLRQVDSSSASGRRLAKRHYEADDPETLIRTAIGKMMNNFRDGKNKAGSVQSFLSLASTGEIIHDAVEEFRLNKDAYENLGVMDLLRCIGAVGIAFTANVGDYPDPWSFRVKDVWFGQYLAQPDLINAFTTGTPIGPAGYPDQVITGCDPMGFADDMSTVRFYCHSGISRFHASVFMRRVIAVIPKDALAMKSAVLMRMQDLAAATPSELRVADTLTNLNTLRAIAPVDLFSPEFLENPLDPKLWVAETGITNVLKVFSWACISNLDKDCLRDLYRHMCQLDLYYVVCGKFQTQALDERAPIVQSLLGIDFTKGVRPTPPGEPEPEPQDIVYPKLYDVDASYLRAIQWLDSECFDRWTRLIRWRMATDGTNDPQIIVNRLKQKHPYIDIRSGLLHTIIAALTARDLSDYLVKLDNSGLITQVVSEQYRQNYNERLKHKHHIEETRRLRLAIDRLTWACDIDEFIDILKREIPNSDGHAFKDLLKTLAETVQVPILSEKVWVMAFGRHPECDLALTVWNHGNLAGHYDRKALQKLLTDAGLRTDKYLDAVRRLGYVGHVYRESDIPNRHGHCNSNPYHPPDE